MSRSTDRVRSTAPAHAPSRNAPPRNATPRPVAGPRPRTGPRTGRRASLPGILLALLLALFGGSATAQQPGHDVLAGAQSVGVGTYHQNTHEDAHQDTPQHLQTAIPHPAHAATHAPLPLLPAVEGNGSPERHSHVLPERPALSAAHLTHHSPRQGRAPPARTGI